METLQIPIKKDIIVMGDEILSIRSSGNVFIGTLDEIFKQAEEWAEINLEIQRKLMWGK